MNNDSDVKGIVELVEKLAEKYSGIAKNKKVEIGGATVKIIELWFKALRELVGYSDRDVVELAKSIISKTYRLMVTRGNFNIGIVLNHLAPVYLSLYNPNPTLNTIVVENILASLGELGKPGWRLAIDWRTALLIDGQTAYSDLDGIHVTQYFLLDYLFLKNIDEELLDIRGIRKDEIDEVVEPLYYPLSSTYAAGILLHELLHIALAHNVQVNGIVREALAAHGDRGYNIAYAVANIVADLFVNKVLTSYLAKTGLLDNLRSALTLVEKVLGATVSERRALLSMVSEENYSIDELKHYSVVLTGDENYVFNKSFSDTIMKIVRDYINGKVKIDAIAYKHSPITGEHESAKINVKKERLIDYFLKGYTVIKITIKRWLGFHEESMQAVLNNILNGESEKIITNVYGSSKGAKIILVNKADKKKVKKWLEAKKTAKSNPFKIVDPSYIRDSLIDIRSKLSQQVSGIGAIISEILYSVNLGEHHYILPWFRELYTSMHRTVDNIIYKYTFNPPNLKYHKRVGGNHIIYYKMRKQQHSLLDILLLVDISGSMMEEETLKKVFRVIRDIYNSSPNIRVYLFWWMSGYAELAGNLRDLAKKWFKPSGEARVELPGTGGTEIRPVLEMLLKLDSGEEVKPVEEDYLTHVEGNASIDLSRSIVVVITDSLIYDLENYETRELLREVAERSHKVYWLTTLEPPDFDEKVFGDLVEKKKIEIHYLGEKTITRRHNI